MIPKRCSYISLIPGDIQSRKYSGITKLLAHEKTLLETMEFCFFPFHICGLLVLKPRVWGVVIVMAVVCGLKERPIWNQRAVKGEILMKNTPTAEFPLCRSSYPQCGASKCFYLCRYSLTFILGC
jgi:hypothetical protein